MPTVREEELSKHSGYQELSKQLADALSLLKCIL